jgi:hypothetical protein
MLFCNFLTKGFFIHGINYTHISLIPKYSNASVVTDF